MLYFLRWASRRSLTLEEPPLFCSAQKRGHVWNVGLPLKKHEHFAGQKSWVAIQVVGIDLSVEKITVALDD